VITPARMGPSRCKEQRFGFLFAEVTSLAKPLADIMHSKTKGLSLFVSKMLQALNRDGLLQVDLDSQ
jgi:predicted ATPase